MITAFVHNVKKKGYIRASVSIILFRKVDRSIVAEDRIFVAGIRDARSCDN